MDEPLTLAEIAHRGIDIPTAVALVLAVAQRCEQPADAPLRRAVPARENIVLDSKGRVSFRGDVELVEEPEHVKTLAVLLKSLLEPNQDESGSSGVHAPGALLLLITRATGSMDLPVPAFSVFRDGLVRFGHGGEDALALLYRRCIVQRPDRRTRAPRASDLRRELRELELALFAQASSRSANRLPAWAAVAAMLAMAAVLASYMIGVRVIAPTIQPRRAQEVPVVRPSEPAPSRGVPDSHAAGSEPAPFSRPALPTATTASATPVLTAAAIGHDLFSPSFVNDGHALLFHSGRAGSSLMRLALDDSTKPSLATILDDGASNFHAADSPDGQWLAYDSDRDGTRAVYVAHADGRDATKVSGEGYAAVPRWSPDGRELAFIKAEPDRPRVWNVWIADLAAHSLTRVSHHAIGQAWSASWFPGGTRLAYSVEDRLVIADLARGTRRVVHSPVRARLIRTPAVSPDGKWIVFQVQHDGAWLLQTATGRMQRVLRDPTAEEFAWSPDSRHVVYHTHRGGGWSLWQLAVDRRVFTS